MQVGELSPDHETLEHSSYEGEKPLALHDIPQSIDWFLYLVIPEAGYHDRRSNNRTGLGHLPKLLECQGDRENPDYAQMDPPDKI